MIPLLCPYIGRLTSFKYNTVIYLTLFCVLVGHHFRIIDCVGIVEVQLLIQEGLLFRVQLLFLVLGGLSRSIGFGVEIGLQTASELVDLPDNTQLLSSISDSY
jgi:hypothetical protein